jgi:predicted SnoaL-like aldol condensation-catalyzing enzyme
MSELATSRRLLERLHDCAEREDLASLLGELGVATAREATDAAASRDLVRRYFEMWNTADRSEADAVLGPTYLDHAHPSVIGPAAVRSLVRRFRYENPDVWMTAEIVAAHADYVLARRTIRSSSLGTMEPFGVVLFRVEGGRLAEQWSHFPAPRRRSTPPHDPSVALRNYF